MHVVFSGIYAAYVCAVTRPELAPSISGACREQCLGRGINCVSHFVVQGSFLIWTHVCGANGSFVCRPMSRLQVEHDLDTGVIHLHGLPAPIDKLRENVMACLAEKQPTRAKLVSFETCTAGGDKNMPSPRLLFAAHRCVPRGMSFAMLPPGDAMNPTNTAH